ncbi:transglutaminase domain-containing protein [Candidatus Woesearchaeota archaeon]|nr:transglutaminase domain-containing protein [Candidatus Woesearchaeota archaeon]
MLDENHEEIEEKESWYKGPLKIIIGLFLLLLIIMWLVPFYGIKQNPEPNRLVELDELNTQMEIPLISSSDIRDYVLVNSEIKQVADRIVSLSCSQTHRVCNAKALFYFVRDNFDYVNDPLAFEYYKTPQESFSSQNGDCDDASILLSSLLRSVGFQTRFVQVPRHIFVQVKIPEAVSSYKTEADWINLDATCSNCEFGEMHYSYTNSNKNFIE